MADKILKIKLEVHLCKILLLEAAFQCFSIKLLFKFYGRYFLRKQKTNSSINF